MSYQVGDIAQFVVNTVSEPGSIYSYVWRFWDTAIQVGTTGTTFKRINIGGDPSNGNQLIYACSPVMITGESVNLYGTITANNPPYIRPSPSISKNDDYYGYRTDLSLAAYTIDANDPILFLWYDGATFLSYGVAAAAYVTGTHIWSGNDTSTSVAFNGTYNSLSIQVNADRNVQCYVVDTAAGTTVVDFRLRGKTVPPLGGVLVADSNMLTTDATSQPRTRIGPGQTVMFVAYVKDIDNAYPSFIWNLPSVAPGNWTTPYLGAGTGAVLPDGSFSNTYVKDVSNGSEVVTVGTVKVCVATCQITGTNPASRSFGQSTQLQFTVELVKNQAPSNTTVTCTDINGAIISMTTGQVVAGAKIIYSAVSTDNDLDVVDQHWRFDNSAAPLFPNPLHLFGPKVVYDTTGMTSGQKILGVITSTDRMGDSIAVSFSGPEIQ